MIVRNASTSWQSSHLLLGRKKMAAAARRSLNNAVYGIANSCHYYDINYNITTILHQYSRRIYNYNREQSSKSILLSKYCNITLATFTTTVLKKEPTNNKRWGVFPTHFNLLKQTELSNDSNLYASESSDHDDTAPTKNKNSTLARLCSPRDISAAIYHHHLLDR
jgi:hypothetical protein